MKWFAVIASAILAVSSAPAVLAASSLADAAEKSDHATLHALLESLSDANAAQPDGMTALHWAAYQDDFETAKLLLKAGANAKATNSYGVTPLSLACLNGNGE